MLMLNFNCLGELVGFLLVVLGIAQILPAALLGPLIFLGFGAGGIHAGFWPAFFQFAFYGAFTVALLSLLARMGVTTSRPTCTRLFVAVVLLAAGLWLVIRSCGEGISETPQILGLYAEIKQKLGIRAGSRAGFAIL